MFNSHSGHPASRGFTLSGMADSYFEYIVKQYVLTGGVEEELEKMSTTMLETIEQQMLIEKRIHQRNFNTKKVYSGDEKFPPAQDDESGTWNVVYPGTWDGHAV